MIECDLKQFFAASTQKSSKSESQIAAQKSSTTILSFKSSERKVCPSSLGSENCGIRSDCWPTTLAYCKQMPTNTPQVRLEAAILLTCILFTSTLQADL